MKTWFLFHTNAEVANTTMTTHWTIVEIHNKLNTEKRLVINSYCCCHCYWHYYTNTM